MIPYRFVKQKHNAKNIEMYGVMESKNRESPPNILQEP